MRMDRYDNLKENENLKTRTDKNQELYTDVYMNNVYLDIDNLKNVVKNQNEEDKENENLKIVRENKVNNYIYEDKIYNINTLIEEAIQNKKEDNVKRSLDTKVDDLEIDNLIETIQENKEKENNQELLADLVTGDDSTVVIPPLKEPISDKDTEEHQEKQEEKEVSKEESKINPNNIKQQNLLDDSFIENKEKKHPILIILSIIIILIFILGFLFYKKIIRF